MPNDDAEFGATPLSDGRWRFVAWSPHQEGLSVVLCQPDRRKLPMQPHCGFHIAEAQVEPGTKYVFRMPDGREFPDPASRFQPEGVHGPSVVVETRQFAWSDAAFQGHLLRDFTIYELHIGTFTQEGTFDAAVARFDDLVDLGITAVEVMPIAQFPGSRNWGYDGVYPFAVQNSYGGRAGFQHFVDAAHKKGLSVILDVVYNHLGPEGNYFGQFGPFFTDRYSTPWGEAINFDRAESGPVRNFFIQNALYWLTEFHVDALRLDAVHGIFDFSAHHFLAELQEKVSRQAAETGRKLHVIAESDLNDSRLLHDPEHGGYGLDAQWSDDFHHALHVLLTKEKNGYYADFGLLEDLAAVLRDGWRYAGQYSPFRKRRHGNSPTGIASDRLVVFNQNHDQVGNRAMGDRLSTLVDYEGLKLAAGMTLLSPFLPLIFMGEEYGETHPFQYFTSHGDPNLVAAVRKGRREEFASFGWKDEVPDPQSEMTFERSILDWAKKEEEPNRSLRALHKALLSIRKKFQLAGSRPRVGCDEKLQTLTLEYSASELLAVFYFGDESRMISIPRAYANGTVVIHSNDSRWGSLGPGNESQLAKFELRLNRTSFAALTTSRDFAI